MSKQGRILVVDDLKEWRDQITQALQRGGFQADAVATPVQALEQLNATLYHVLILDIRMDETDLNNVDGIKLLRQLHQQKVTEAVKVIMLSAYGTAEQMRESFRDYGVADFLSKSKFNNHAILEAVQRLFKNHNNINLALKIGWQSPSEPKQVIRNLKIDGKRIKHNKALQKQVLEELDDLLCRLFKDANGLIVRSMLPGYSGSAVLRVQPFYEEGGGQQFVVKFGDVKDIEEEHKNFKKYVQTFLGGSRNSTVIDARYTPHLGGIVYSFLGAEQDNLIALGEFYQLNEISQITKVLDSLFMDTCRNWYANAQGLQQINLTDLYQGLLSYSPKQLERLRLSRLTDVQGKQRLTFSAMKSSRTFTNPILAIMNRKFIYSTYLCTTHGDFNLHNQLVDQSTGHVWLIDFQSTGRSHIFRDVVALDATIRFQLLTDQDVTLDECLEMEEVLCSIKHFSEIERLSDKLKTENLALAKVCESIIHFYKIARQISKTPSDDIGEYYIALLYNALNTIRFESLQSLQREHALLCASLLADKLGLSSC